MIINNNQLFLLLYLAKLKLLHHITSFTLTLSLFLVENFLVLKKSRMQNLNLLFLLYRVERKKQKQIAQIFLGGGGGLLYAF